MQPAGGPLDPWRAESFGARVQRGGRGQVHSVFARAVNLVGERGTLTALLAADAPRVAHGVRLRECHGNLSRWFSVGAAFWWDGEDVCVASRLAGSVRIATSASEIWHGRVQCSSGSRDDIARAAVALRATPHPRPSPGPHPTLSRKRERDLSVYWGEGNSPSPWTGESWGEGDARAQRAQSPSPSTGEGWGEGDSRAQRAVKLRLLALRDAYRAGDADAIAHTVHGLIGLGPGLTPAGDDALIGWLAGAALLGADRRCEVLRDAVRACLGRTNDVSRAHLEDALAGEFSEPLAQFANALARTPADARRALADLAAVGASSGLDAAAGLLAAVEAAVGTEPCHG
jgi:hypothetical protein